MKTEVIITGQNRPVAATISETKVTTLFGDEYAHSEVRLAPTRIVKAGTTHLYNLGVQVFGVYGQIDVEANNRDQATRMAERAGYVVNDCNMIG